MQGKFAKYKKYVGHSAHVTNCRFSHGDKKLVTTGGADTSVMVWNHISATDRTTACGESDESDTESEEEGGRGYIVVKKLLSWLLQIITFIFMFT